MKLKGILRIVGRILYWVILGHLISLCISGNSTIIVKIVLGFYFASILFYIFNYISNRRLCARTIKGYKDVFDYFSRSHSARYYCYLKGDLEGAKAFEEIMNMCTDTIFKIGPNILKYKETTNKERQEIQKMMDKAKVLLNQIQPLV